MRLRTIGLAAALSAALIQTSSAVVQPKGAESPIVAAGKAPRSHRTIEWSRASQMSTYGLTGWTAMWDRDTNVPLRLWGSGSFTAGSVATPAIALAAAQGFLAQHLDLLAPGAQATDFVVVANQLSPDGDVRSVGFEQRSNGVPVLGGAIGFSFKNDRMIMVGSTALPGVHIAAQAPTRLDGQRLGASAIGWLSGEGHNVAVQSISADRVIIPMIHPRGAQGPDIAYRLAERVTVASTTDEGRWDVFIDAADASPIARKTTIMYASGKILFDVPDRNPTSTRSPHAAPQVSHTINTVATVSGLDGSVTWDGTAAATVIPGLTGPMIAITNKQGSLTTDSLSIADGATVTWSKATDEFGDAQLDSFVFASTAKAYVRANLNPQLTWLNEALSVNVNENQTCNAYSTGDDIHFYKASSNTTGTSTATSCQNTGRIADVVYHEFGHSVHANSIIPGVGAFDGSLSEGLADLLAANITDDHGMGRGFFFTDAALRDLAPAMPKHWPEDADGEVHDEGEIIGESIWSLKTALVAQYGAEVGNAKERKIYYGVMQRAADIPSAYAEALVTDDDDGDLTNGTPNMCAINSAFGIHGLADPATSLGISAPTRDNFAISITAHPPAAASACAGAATIAKATVDWKKRDGQPNTLDLTATGATYSGAIPTQPEGTVVQYKVSVTLTDGSSITYPNNPADPFYEFYVGSVTKLWCTDFENGASDWTHGATPTNRDEWEVGPPMGLGGDPKTAHGGANVFGIDLSTDGQYRRSAMLWAESPEIDLQGNANVRLQYYRWLGVEDGFYDQARIMVNGTKAWTNYASAMDTMNGTNFQDKEWRFQDVDLAPQAATGKVKIRFELDSDQGGNYSGWTVDDICVVSAAPAPTCGNGVLDDGEQCDDGNIDDGDSCSATCTLPGTTKDGTGCCSVGATPGGAAFLSMLTLGALIRRRKRTK